MITEEIKKIEKVIKKFNKLYAEVMEYYGISNLCKVHHYDVTYGGKIILLSVCEKDGYTNRSVNLHNVALYDKYPLAMPFQAFVVYFISKKYDKITDELYNDMNSNIEKIRKRGN